MIRTLILLFVAVAFSADAYGQTVLPTLPSGWRYQYRMVEELVVKKDWKVVTDTDTGFTESFVKFLADRGITEEACPNLTADQLKNLEGDARRVGVITRNPPVRELQFVDVTEKVKRRRLWPVKIEDSFIELPNVVVVRSRGNQPPR